MNKLVKQLSNPFSTGGGGQHFEAHIQAMFVTLMLTGGFAPCLPTWPIKKIKLQCKIDGFDTDDLVVFVEDPVSKQERKLIAQIKHTISITQNDKKFGEVIKAAWNDFNKPSLFEKGKDRIALITGPISKTDAYDVSWLLDQARHTNQVDEFLIHVNKMRFSSEQKRQKLAAFQNQLKKANNACEIPNNCLYSFLRHFYLIGCDLGKEEGVILSLLHSHMSQVSIDPFAIWGRIVDFVQTRNQNAGTITPENIPENLREAFEQKISKDVIPDKWSVKLSSEKEDWNHHAHASTLVVANLLGGWNENNKADCEVVRQLANKDFDSWIPGIREILQHPSSPVSLINGLWSVSERKSLWKTMGSRVFDKDLDNLKRCAVAVLSERDPKFELPSQQRYAANIYGKALKHSYELRKGLAESLALLGTRPAALIHCSQHKLVITLTIREILENADWVLWGSLDGLLPILAEAAPDEFLRTVENALHQNPCPFDDLFAQENVGIFGGNYINGLFWALETLAWDEEFIVQACVTLGELAAHDLGDNWANRPVNSLTRILLPWLPRTTAPLEKRMAALKTLQKEFPKVAWRVLLSLLPGQTETSSSTHKPSWRDTFPDEWKEGVSNKEYWEQVVFCAELTVEMASIDIEKLECLIDQLDNLPEPAFSQALEYLSSETISNRPEEQRMGTWTKLVMFTRKHREFPDAKWALQEEKISRIEHIAANLAPKDPFNIHRMVFSKYDFPLYEETEDWQKLEKNRNDCRQQVVKEILSRGGMDSIIRFAQDVELSRDVGHALAFVSESKIDERILPVMLEIESAKLTQFAKAYVWRRCFSNGWAWVDGLDRSHWSASQVGQFLSWLPFTKEAWKRATNWLGENEREYWGKVRPNPYDTDDDKGFAIDKLVEYGRPRATIESLYRMLHKGQLFDKRRVVTSLLAAVSSTESDSMNTYNIIELIESLQSDPETSPEDLFRIEWAYLSLLNRQPGVLPKTIENKLASDPIFFCEVIRRVYRSKKETGPRKKLSERDNAMISNASRLLNIWKTPPGKQSDGTFLPDNFRQWLAQVKKSCYESGHLEVVLFQIGQVLIHSPPDPDGLWIHHSVADALNDKSAEIMREGYNTGIFNSRGAHFIDPTGKPEMKLAEEYKQKAEQIENSGYQRFSATLRKISERYSHEAEQIFAAHRN